MALVTNFCSCEGDLKGTLTAAEIRQNFKFKGLYRLFWTDMIGVRVSNVLVEKLFFAHRSQIVMTEKKRSVFRKLSTQMACTSEMVCPFQTFLAV